MCAGILVGHLLKKKSFIHKISAQVKYVIIILLFTMGMNIGSDKKIIADFLQLGWQGFVIAALATFGSVLAAWCVYRFVFSKQVQK